MNLNYNEGADLSKDELVTYLQVFHGRYADEYYENQSQEKLLQLYNEMIREVD